MTDGKYVFLNLYKLLIFIIKKDIDLDQVKFVVTNFDTLDIAFLDELVDVALEELCKGEQTFEKLSDTTLRKIAQKNLYVSPSRYGNLVSLEDFAELKSENDLNLEEISEIDKHRIIIDLFKSRFITFTKP